MKSLSPAFSLPGGGSIALPEATPLAKTAQDAEETEARGYLRALAVLIMAVPTALTLAGMALLILLLSSCTVIHGDATKGTYTYASMGGDVKEYSQSATAVTAGAVDNSTSFRETTKAVRWGLVAAATQSIAGDALGAWRGVTAAKEATKATGIRSAASVKEAQIAADVQKTALSTEAAATAP